MQSCAQTVPDCPTAMQKSNQIEKHRTVKGLIKKSVIEVDNDANDNKGDEQRGKCMLEIAADVADMNRLTLLCYGTKI